MTPRKFYFDKSLLKHESQASQIAFNSIWKICKLQTLFFFLGGGVGISKKFIQKRKENEGATQVQKVNIMGAIKKKQRNKKNK